MTAPGGIPGVFGKIPAKGDFISQRLPASFVDIWDRWLRTAIAESRHMLGEDWLEYYLTSPIWRFVLGPGIIAGGPWIGILMPSVDRVGRYFPLTLAVPAGDAHTVAAACDRGSAWFDALEQLALTALEDDFDLGRFDRQLQELRPPRSPHAAQPAGRRRWPDGGPGDGPGDGPSHGRSHGRSGLRIPAPGGAAQGQGRVALGAQLLVAFAPACSLWTTAAEIDDERATVMWVFDGLPAARAYADLLTEAPSTATATEVERPAAEPSPAVEATELLPVAGGGEERTVDRLPPATPPQPAAPDLAPLAGTGALLWRGCGLTNVGKRRSRNQDAFLVRERLGLWAVADGMGGHTAGEVASRSAMEGLERLTPDRDTALAEAVQAALLETNQRLIGMAAERGPDEIIGATVVVLLASGSRCTVIWAGDSRLYRYRDGKLAQLTEDHSIAVEMAEAPSADTMPGGLGDNIVTRALGADADLELDRLDFEAAPGDRYLLCSDGLTKELHPAEIEQLLMTGACEEIVARLIDLALERQARDNVTAIVIEAAPL